MLFLLAMLNTKGFTVSGSSETIQDLAVYALHDDKYWMPLKYPASLNIDLKELYYISEIELASKDQNMVQLFLWRHLHFNMHIIWCLYYSTVQYSSVVVLYISFLATPSNSAKASLSPPVKMRLGSSKVPLVTSRYEGPLLSQKTRTIPLISIDACRQRQTQSTFSIIKISPLKMDQTVDRGMLVFNLVCASEDNEGKDAFFDKIIKYFGGFIFLLYFWSIMYWSNYFFAVRYVREFTILEPNLSIQCLPAPNADQQVRLDESSQQPLTVSFSNVYDSIVLRPANAPVTCTQLIVYYPENGMFKKKINSSLRFMWNACKPILVHVASLPTFNFAQISLLTMDYKSMGVKK